jgi:hypothetical protein
LRAMPCAAKAPSAKKDLFISSYFLFGIHVFASLGFGSFHLKRMKLIKLIRCVYTVGLQRHPTSAQCH